jgi:hypothetical protein
MTKKRSEMTPEELAKARERDRRYSGKNRERKAAARRAWYEANPERLTEAHKAWYEANRERAAETSKAWREANRERKAETDRAWREAKRERKAETHKANLEKANGRAKKIVSNALRRDLKRGFPSARVIDWQQVAQLIDAGRCESTGVRFDLSSPKNGQRVNPLAPSIDKVNPKKPYQPNRGRRNWQLTTTAYNLSRGELSAPEFLATVVHPVQAKAGANPFPLDTLAGDTMHMLAMPFASEAAAEPC